MKKEEMKIICAVDTRNYSGRSSIQSEVIAQLKLCNTPMGLNKYVLEITAVEMGIVDNSIIDNNLLESLPRHPPKITSIPVGKR